MCGVRHEIMSPSTPLPYSVKKLAYCAGLVALLYWLPLAYLAVNDPRDEGRGGMVLCFSVLIAIPAILISTAEFIKVLRHYKDAGPPPPLLAFSLFGVTISPLVVLFFGILRHA